MPSYRFMPRIFVGATIAFALTVSASAQLNRSFVATTGNDANNCSATAACRTFPRALAVTNAGGEIVVLNSGGYGPATISQAVTISADGVVASITQATSGQNGLTINTSGNVTLSGLSLHGQASGAQGILVQNVGGLLLNDITVESFTENGLEVFGGNVAVENSTFNSNGGNGIAVDSSAGAFVHNTTFTGNGAAGFLLGSGTAILVNCSAKGSGSGFQVGYPTVPSSGGPLYLVNSESFYNNVGLLTNTSISVIRLSYSVVAQNFTDAYKITDGAIQGTNPGTNVIIGAGSGTLGTAVTLQ